MAALPTVQRTYIPTFREASASKRHSDEHDKLLNIKTIVLSSLLVVNKDVCAVHLNERVKGFTIYHSEYKTSMTKTALALISRSNLCYSCMKAQHGISAHQSNCDAAFCIKR